MKAKCKKCGKSLDTKNAFKVIIKGKNTYYCNEQEWNELEKEKELKKAISSKSLEILGGAYNTVLNKEIAVWCNMRNLDVVYSCLIDNEDNINNILRRKNFDSDYGKVRYFSAIIKNILSSCKPIEEDIRKKCNVELYESKYKPMPRRKCLSDYDKVILDG